MVKIQIYMSEAVNGMMDKIAKKRGILKSQLLRIAVEDFLRKYGFKNLDEAFGIWKGYDLNLEGMRHEWER